MGEKMADRDPSGNAVVFQGETGQVGAYRRVEIQFAFGDKPHDGGAGEGLGYRPDLEEGIGGDRLVRLEIGHAEDGMLFLAIHADAERRARNAMFDHCSPQDVSNSAEPWRGISGQGRRDGRGVWPETGRLCWRGYGSLGSGWEAVGAHKRSTCRGGRGQQAASREAGQRNLRNGHPVHHETLFSDVWTRKTAYSGASMLATRVAQVLRFTQGTDHRQRGRWRRSTLRHRRRPRLAT